VTVMAAGQRPLREPEGAAGPPRPFHVTSYRPLLRFPEVPAAAGTASLPAVDAIVVPTIRGAEQLVSSVRLALAARCQLVTIHTDGFPAGLEQVLAPIQHRGLATPLALRARGTHHLLDLGAGLPQSLGSSCARDISRKRNLGLLVGRACGWRRMLFLDDDIRKINATKLGSAAALLDHYPVVGLQVTKYPDASVVGHARRMAGRRQEPFISGGALLVDPQRLSGFFPPVYHEDWLCIIGHLSQGDVAIGGTVGQVPYEPFTTAQRAKLEEFGDILASGLLWLIYAGGKTSRMELAATARNGDFPRSDYWSEATRESFWGEVLSQRAALLDDLASALGQPCRHKPLPVQSVLAARERCGQLCPAEFVSFVERWLANLSSWRAQAPDPFLADSVAKAISELGLSHAVRLQEGNRGRVRSAWDSGIGRLRDRVPGLRAKPPAGAGRHRQATAAVSQAATSRREC
jgi:hypothetical protein